MRPRVSDDGDDVADDGEEGRRGHEKRDPVAGWECDAKERARGEPDVRAVDAGGDVESRHHDEALVGAVNLAQDHCAGEELFQARREAYEMSDEK